MPSPRKKSLSGKAPKGKSDQDNIDDAAAATAAAADEFPPRAKSDEDEPLAKKTNNDEESKIAVAAESKGGSTEPSKQAADPGEESERQARDDDATKKNDSPTKKQESTNIGAKDKDKLTATSYYNKDASPSKALNEEATEEGSNKPSSPAGDDVASDKTKATDAQDSEPKSKDKKSSKKDEVKPSSDNKGGDKSAEKTKPPEKTPSTPITVHSPPKRADATIYYDDPEEKIMASKNKPVVAHAPPPGAADRVNRSEKNTPKRHTPPPVLDTKPQPAVQQARIPPKPIDTSSPLSPPVISKPPPRTVPPPVEGEVTTVHKFPIVLPPPEGGLIQVPDSEVAQTYSETIFPMKLYDMLCNPEFHHAVAWLPHGRSWRVLNKDTFMAEICPQYFSQTRYESFVRQVNGWGFKRMRREGPDRGSYYHEHFLRGYAHMIDHMRRPAPGEKSRDVREEPDLYALQPMPLLPQDRDRVARFLASKSKAGRPMGSTVKTIPGGGHLHSSYDEMALPQQGLEGQEQQSGAAVAAGQIPSQQMSGYNPYMSYPPMPMSPYGQSGPPMGYPPMMGYYPPPYMYGDPSQFYGQQQALPGSQQALRGQQQVPGTPQAATQTLAATPSSAKRKRGKLDSEAEAATKKQRAEPQDQQALPAGAGQISRYPPPMMGPGMGPPMGIGYYGGAPPASPYQAEAATRKQHAEPQFQQALPAGAGQVSSYPPPMGSGMAPPPMGMGYYGNVPPASPYRPAGPAGSAPMMQGYGPAAPMPGTPQGGMPYAYPQPLSYPPVSGYGGGLGPQMPMGGDPSNPAMGPGMPPDPNNLTGPGAGQMGTSMHGTYNTSQSGGPPPPSYPGPPTGPY